MCPPTAMTFNSLNSNLPRNSVPMLLRTCQGARVVEPSYVFPSIRAEPVRELVLTSACKFAENELLGQTACNMQAHSDSEVFEYMLSIAVRTWVVREGDRRGNQTATPGRVVRLRPSVVSLTQQSS